MDVNKDGAIDILSGSYSRHDSDMAGLFQVLYGREEGGFAAARPLVGSDGEPLIITAGDGDQGTIDKICTRPFAVDLDGDGHLDIVSGNFRGTFALFRGDGKGRFSPTSEWMKDSKDRKLQVDAHSDPFLVDWDGDGDFDLLSGASAGGVFLFVNEGSKTEPSFGERMTLVEPVGHSFEERLGDAHVTGPQSATRVWADDVDGDGKLDLLVGDNVTLHFPVGGLDEETVRKRLAKWNEDQAALFESRQLEPGQRLSDEEQKRFQESYEALRKERATFIEDDRTGFVWLLRQS